MSLMWRAFGWYCRKLEYRRFLNVLLPLEFDPLCDVDRCEFPARFYGVDRVSGEVVFVCRTHSFRLARGEMVAVPLKLDTRDSLYPVFIPDANGLIEL